MRHSSRAFTLVELLVVVGIIGGLLALLLPALASANKGSHSAACLTQLRMIAQGTIGYAQDNCMRFPRSSHSAMPSHVMPWGYAILPYLAKEKYKGPGKDWDAMFNGLYRCPDDVRTDEWSYGKNVWFELSSSETGEALGLANGPTYAKLDRLPRTQTTILFGELGSGSMADHIMAHFWRMGGLPEVDSTRHGTASNYVFCDGHAESLDFTATFNLDAKLDLWNPGPTR